MAVCEAVCEILAKGRPSERIDMANCNLQREPGTYSRNGLVPIRGEILLQIMLYTCKFKHSKVSIRYYKACST